MQHFQNPPGALRRLGLGARLVYTGYLVFAVAGLLSAALLHLDGLGTDAATAASYWRGDEAAMLYPKSYRQLVELSHFHLFTEPVTFLVVAHLYNLGSDSPKRKVVASAGTLLSMALQIALPWLVVYVSAAFAVLFLPAHTGLLVGLLYMALRAAHEMWRG